MNDYFKYLATVFIEYVEQPKDVRKEKRAVRKAGKQPIAIRLFGLVPFAMSQKWKEINQVIRRRDRR